MSKVDIKEIKRRERRRAWRLAKKTAFSEGRGLTERDLRNAAKILNLDMALNGAIRKAECPQHKRKYLLYYYRKSQHDVKVYCRACGWETTFNEEREVPWRDTSIVYRPELANY